jgi:membrane-associated phospholipid phosphatase
MTRWLVVAAWVPGLLTCLVIVGIQVGHHGWPVEVDDAVTRWLVGHRIPMADDVALAVTNAVGPAEILVAAVLVAMTALVRFRSYLRALVVIVTVGGASTLCTALKFAFARARPPIAIQETRETDYSFPSGHVTGTASLIGIAAVVVGVNRGRAVKRWLAGLVIVVVATVGLSRIYLGVHWLTDVLAGILLAAAAVAIGSSVLVTGPPPCLRPGARAAVLDGGN